MFVLPLSTTSSSKNMTMTVIPKCFCQDLAMMTTMRSSSFSSSSISMTTTRNRDEQPYPTFVRVMGTIIGFTTTAMSTTTTTRTAATPLSTFRPTSPDHDGELLVHSDLSVLGQTNNYMEHGSWCLVLDDGSGAPAILAMPDHIRNHAELTTLWNINNVTGLLADCVVRIVEPMVASAAADRTHNHDNPDNHHPRHHGSNDKDPGSNRLQQQEQQQQHQQHQQPNKVLEGGSDDKMLQFWIDSLTIWSSPGGGGDFGRNKSNNRVPGKPVVDHTTDGEHSSDLDLLFLRSLEIQYSHRHRHRHHDQYYQQNQREQQQQQQQQQHVSIGTTQQSMEKVQNAASFFFFYPFLPSFGSTTLTVPVQQQRQQQQRDMIYQLIQSSADQGGTDGGTTLEDLALVLELPEEEDEDHDEVEQQQQQQQQQYGCRTTTSRRYVILQHHLEELQWAGQIYRSHQGCYHPL